MQISEYQNIYENEASHFFYVGNHFVILNLVRKYANSVNHNILDAGCGTGLLAKKLQLFGSVTGVDISPEAIKYAKKRGVNARLASIAKLPFKKATFDLVVSVDVLYHQKVKNDRTALLEFKRVLKPGGVLILKVPAYNWLRGSHDIVVHTKHRYTTEELERLAVMVGLKVIKASYFASFLLPLAILKRLYESIAPIGNTESDVRPAPPFLNSFMITLYKLESFLLAFVNLPFGLSTFVVLRKTGKRGTNRV
ncbi:MAG: hypothetical protein A2700_01975 [Candidatus Blackburnbacteria bacterium RIFCSPHIGHO2_01_FULL_44_64]|uniref:Methyltransferase type 11 domain-containing protein n=1 Tax=Candidatus Blackburnbacteria bacterium RIFCSPHIGHO2_02_FULL_44_20 TaxID=1797516 RepID=A0A1G1V993_9BACT|nr:MAG: hypothetical protein A2700_01975 [Candidatus Blackburnbacteria bacterium RIFCSPHIGHO2_01_FULL_44_64]OGY10309.1 MAG: hypothetical protein A3E16_04390 [Candidatus Blackburnbacteria bacterium RIFCSPHIGHO2_12_FULL_44_25]OGY11990.1 MAG: hypothetical protein A3D26_03535 [Candidatus Blackburnbacteria bacterium RIFCSPHIGHO2_02_FULL_44_20]OGY14657.1 MAG: hypothetical protein A3A62_00435 [Candidatus Blackburnbacteria bacterium RIFCSPLOWO2_01_FULL_44_43]